MPANTIVEEIKKNINHLAIMYPGYEFLAKKYDEKIVDYAKDNRTIEEMQVDYDIGIEMENRIIKYFKTLGVVYTTDDKDKWLNPSLYVPDCIILRRNGLLPLEIKYTKHIIDKVQWKKKQLENMKTWEGYLLQVSGNRFCLIPRHQVGTVIEANKSYCNKECVEFEVTWRKLSELKELFF